MRFVFQVFNEQIKNIQLIFRLAAYDIKSEYQLHYLGVLWQFLNPLIQIITYWVVFGLGIRRGSPIGDTPFLVWMLLGIIPWFFLSAATIQGSNSVYKRVNLVSKMKFPLSILPTIAIFSNFFSFLIMLVILMLILLLNGINPSIYWIQFPYFIFCFLVFLFSLTLFCSTISIIVRDFQILLQSMMRLLLYLSPVLWDVSTLPKFFHSVLQLNPFYYLIEGFRKTFLGHTWFYHDLKLTVYFWITTLLILLLGSISHVKLRNKFVDFL